MQWAEVEDALVVIRLRCPTQAVAGMDEEWEECAAVFKTARNVA